MVQHILVGSLLDEASDVLNVFFLSTLSNSKYNSCSVVFTCFLLDVVLYRDHIL